MADGDTSSDFLREIDELLQDTASTEDVQATSSQQIPEQTGTPAVAGSSRRDESPVIGDKTGLLRQALADHEDVEVLRQLCADGVVPDELRCDLWREVLGVSRRPDAIGSWSGPLDCENQSLLHQHCQEQAERVGDMGVADVVEQVVTFYCKSRNVRYSEECGWVEVMVSLASAGMTKPDLFNCLYSMVSKYIPRECRAGGRPFDLFRLLLLYHDPELCSLLDTRRIPPHMYMQSWLRSVFSAQCDSSVTHRLWDMYLLERDPFLIFFLSLVMIVNAKEMIVESGSLSPVELQSLLVPLPEQLTVDDIPDFFSLAQYYASRTPQSFRKDYQSALFGSGRSLSTNTLGVLCLPVHLQEVLDTIGGGEENGGINYTVVDCRPLKQFSCGHFPRAMHLDADLLLHSPQDFAVAMERLCDRVRQQSVGGGGGEGGDHHLCFLGSGRESEDQYMHMVVAKFLQKSIPYISFARGGFLEAWQLLGAQTPSVMEDFDHEQCQRLYFDWDGDTAHPPTNSLRNETSDSDSEGRYSTSSQYRQRLHTKGAQLYASLASGWRDKSQRMTVKMGQWWKARNSAGWRDRPIAPEEKKGKRYRNLPANVFVIADEDEEAEGADYSSSGEDTNPQLVNISMYSTAPGVLHSYPCSEVTTGGQLLPSHLVLTTDTLVILRELSDRAGWGRVRHTHKLLTIFKITAKKRHPDVVTFRFSHDEDDDNITPPLRLRIPNTSKATSAIASQIMNNMKR